MSKHNWFKRAFSLKGAFPLPNFLVRLIRAARSALEEKTDA